MPRSRVEALLASFPKLADSGTQHTTVEQDNVRFVYQPLDELYMVLITNRQSNILQDIDSLHLFAQVVTSTCKSVDEREILKNAYDLLSAFDEIVTLGYRENLTINQIRTFMEMESHEERVQELIARNKEHEATEERKRKAKQLEMQRKESARLGHNPTPRAPVYPTYTTPPVRTEVYDSYAAEKNKVFNKWVHPSGPDRNKQPGTFVLTACRPGPSKIKGMQLGKKSKTTDMFEKVRVDIGGDDQAPLITPITHKTTAAAPVVEPSEPRMSSAMDHSAIHVAISETISAKLSRDGAVNALSVSGDLNLRIADPSLTKVKLGLKAASSHGTQFRTHPHIDRNAWNSSKVIQLNPSTQAKGFPVNNSVAVLRWKATPKTDDMSVCPISFTVWINKHSDRCNMTVEYELTGASPLTDVTVAIPFQVEPTVSSLDVTYDMGADTLEWMIGDVDESNGSGSFEFEAETADENEFFPMSVRFSKSAPFVDVDVSDSGPCPLSFQGSARKKEGKLMD